MNALARKELGQQANSQKLISQTREITVYPGVGFLGDEGKPTNFVDLPGLIDYDG